MRRGGCGVWGEGTHVITTLQNGPGVLASGRSWYSQPIQIQVATNDGCIINSHQEYV